MAVYVHIKEDVLTEAKRCGLNEQIKKIVQRIERFQAIPDWDHYEPSPYTKKRIENYRLIAREYFIDNTEDTVISFIKLVPRGDQQYDSDPKNYILRYADSFCVPYNEILKFYQNSKERPPVGLQKERLSDQERYMIYQPGYRQEKDFIYESAYWVDQYDIQRIRDHLYDFKRLISSEFYKKNARETRLEDRELGIGLIYRYYPDDRKLVLIAPYLLSKDNLDLSSFCEKNFGEILDLNNTAFSEDQVLRKCQRGYSELLLAANDDEWKSIIENREANLALSPEELKILEASLNVANTKRFPLFINGRPGSGKSTLLYFLLAHYLVRFFENKYDDEGDLKPPALITFSKSLMESAKSIVEKIIKSNDSLISRIDLDNKRTLFNEAFIEFHEKLRSMLPEEEKKQFSEDKRIQFSDFKKLFDEQFKKVKLAALRDINAEVSWHVIRGYIKGMADGSDSEFCLDDFRELPESQKSIDENTFKTVFKSVWEGWYQNLCQENNYWDDQDLSNHFLSKIENMDFQRYPAIFCDEAQDFTKIEIEIIYHLSLYSQRDIKPDEISHLPFVFAGDPFQTINPTGFSWESTKAGLYEKLLRQFSLRNSNPSVNYRELKYNYRSVDNIVKTGNLIHLLRGLLFAVRGLIPQESWTSGSHFSFPAFFDKDSPQTLEKLRKHRQTITILLPGIETDGESLIEKYREDPFLSKIMPDDSDERAMLYTSIMAKGHEYKRVVLYDFGDYLIREFNKVPAMLDQKDIHFEEGVSRLPLEYFINRLYVAITRPKRRLIIIDSRLAFDRFWNHPVLRDLQALVDQYNRGRRGIWESSYINTIQPGQPDVWEGDKDKPEDMARQFFQSGQKTRSSYDMANAATMYYQCKMMSKYHICRALQQEYKGNDAEAGEWYLKNGGENVEEALQAFWRAGAFNEIYQNHHRFGNRLEYLAAQTKIYPDEHSYRKDFLQRLNEAMLGEDAFSISVCQTYQMFISEILNTIYNNIKMQELTDDLVLLLKIYKKGKQLFIEREKFGSLLYLNDLEDAASEVWNECQQEPKNREYYEYKARYAEYPENIKWLNRLRKSSEAYHQYQKNFAIFPGSGYKEEDLREIKTILREEAFRQDYPHFLYKYKIGNLTDLKIDFDRYYSNNDYDYAIICGRLYIEKLVLEKQYQVAKDFVWDMPAGQLRTRLLYYLLAAYANPKVERLPKIGEDLYNQFNELSRHDLRFYILWAISIEKTGNFLPALRILEYAIEREQNPQSLKKRWLKVKNDYIEHLKKNGLEDKVLQHKSEYTEKRRYFGLDSADIEIEAPLIVPQYVYDEINEEDELLLSNFPQNLNQLLKFDAIERISELIENQSKKISLERKQEQKIALAYLKRKEYKSIQLLEKKLKINLTQFYISRLEDANQEELSLLLKLLAEPERKVYHYHYGKISFYFNQFTQAMDIQSNFTEKILKALDAKSFKRRPTKWNEIAIFLVNYMSERKNKELYIRIGRLFMNANADMTIYYKALSMRQVQAHSGLRQQATIQWIKRYYSKELEQLSNNDNSMSDKLLQLKTILGKYNLSKKQIIDSDPQISFLMAYVPKPIKHSEPGKKEKRDNKLTDAQMIMIRSNKDKISIKDFAESFQLPEKIIEDFLKSIE
jgi:hypothetical protein